MENQPSMKYLDQLKTATAAQNRIEAIEAEIEDLKAFIEKWYSFPDEKTYVDHYVQTYTSFGCLLYPLALMLSIISCTVACLLLTHFTDLRFSIILSGIVGGYLFSFPAVWIISSIRQLHLRKKAKFYYSLQYGYHRLHSSEVIRCRKKIGDLQKAIDEIVQSTPFSREDLPHAQTFLNCAEADRQHSSTE